MPVPGDGAREGLEGAALPGGAGDGAVRDGALPADAGDVGAVGDGVGPEEAVGLSAAETLREQFRTAYPHRPEEDLLLADTSFRAPTIKYVRERAKAGGKVYSYLFDQDFPLMGKSTPWHCADIPFVFHNTELVPVCAFEGAKQLETEIFGAVMQFARTGAPGWAASTEDVEQTMLFGPQSRLVQNHDHALIEALAPFTDLRMKKATRAGGQIQH